MTNAAWIKNCGECGTEFPDELQRRLAEPDYKHLLKQYMLHVYDMESMTYVEDWVKRAEKNLMPEERRALAALWQQIEKEESE